ncbi:helix-turn-helix transcriptional regulator [Pseudomonas fulva]|uniref:helix-turn-helix transcriptional regulator n=1 Tax=Pseudomonas fulva TaxID=47880 RepID=UPI002B1D9365|nr:helix-turn-helix transcriptional regulator [Pseudomonas fulva]
MTRSSTDRRELEDWEKAECAALKEALRVHNASLPKDMRLTQDKLAAELGMTQGNLNGHLNGKRPLNKEMAAKIYSLTGIPVGRYSKRLDAEIKAIASTMFPEGLPREAETTSRWVSHADELLLEVTAAISVIAAQASAKSLTRRQVETLIMLRNEIIHMNGFEPGTRLSGHIAGLIGAAFKAAESGDSPDDLLSMVKHGETKENLKEQGGKNVHARHKKTGSKPD